MSDIVVTVPKTFGLDVWIGEGDPAGVSWSGQIWHFSIGPTCPKCVPGDRVYVIFNGAVRGWSPLVDIEYDGWRYYLVRHGGAVACTVPFFTQGFRGFRYREGWWDRLQELPFPDWQDPNAALFDRAALVKPDIHREKAPPRKKSSQSVRERRWNDPYGVGSEMDALWME